MDRVGQKIVWDSKTWTNFCRKIMLFPKKIKFPLEIRLRFLTFLSKIIMFSKKRSSPETSPRFYIFCPKIVMLSKKKSLIEITLRFLIFRPNIIVFLPTKRFSPRITSPFSNFVPKQRCFLLSSE